MNNNYITIINRPEMIGIMLFCSNGFAQGFGFITADSIKE